MNRQFQIVKSIEEENMRYTSLDIDNLGYNVSYLFFEKKLPSLGYSIRKPQIEYTEDILKMLKNRNKCLIIEAEVGTGKSFRLAV